MTHSDHLNKKRQSAEHIEHRDDPRIADFLDIRDRFLRDGPQGSQAPGRFVGEHALIVERMLLTPGCTRAVLILPNLLEHFEPLVPDGVPLYVAEKSVLSSIAGYPVHRGALAIGNRPSPETLTIDSALPDPRSSDSKASQLTNQLSILVLEDVTHPDNVGMLFRVAAAFGVDAVLLSPGCHDPLYRRAVRLSAGHVLGMPWAWCRRWPDDLDALRDRWHLTLVGGVTDAGAVAVDSAPRPKRIAVVVGTESHGLSDEARRRLDLRVRIPMAPGIDSLNVATAAAVMLHALGQGERV